MSFDKKILASVESAIDNKFKAVHENQQQENLTRAYIQGVITEMTGRKPPNASASAAGVSAQGTLSPQIPSLTQIMERVKNTKKN